MVLETVVSFHLVTLLHSGLYFSTQLTECSFKMIFQIVVKILKYE